MSPLIFARIVYALWVAFVVYLTVAGFGIKRDTEQHLGQSLGLTFAVIVAFILPHVPLFSFVNFAPVNPALSIAGLIIFVVGMIFLVWARQTLGRNWSQIVSAKEDHELVISGPYRLVRHPMYTGGIVAVIGSAIVAGGAFVFVALVLVPLFLWRVGAEDKLMERQFPSDYPAYKERTKALIPFVW
jgi:protein-S-isoprenylcysteine O-methyltransferase Ste14